MPHVMAGKRKMVTMMMKITTGGRLGPLERPLSAKNSRTVIILIDVCRKTTAWGADLASPITTTILLDSVASDSVQNHSSPRLID
jgi:hypothetical protein